MTTDPIAAALKVLANVGMYPTRSTMQAAIEAYEAARAVQANADGVERLRGYWATQEGQRVAAKWCQDTVRFEDGEFSVSIPHPSPASPQTPQTACGGCWDVEVHTVSGWVAALAAERGLTVDEGGE